VTGAPPALRHVREAIEDAFADGATLADVEREIIELTPVSEDAQAALWLFAWGIDERRGTPGARGFRVPPGPAGNTE
jgi:hypothetical protein